MKILIITNHFWPEEFRINDVAQGLVDRGHSVSVLSGTPNYPGGMFFEGYGIFKKWHEVHEGVSIFRAPLIPRGSGTGFRLILNYASYLLSACLLAPFYFRVKYDIIFVFETSPITVGFPAMILKYFKQIPIIFWVQDLWPETLSATGVVKSPKFIKLIGILVKFIYKSCDRILIQSRAFTNSVKALYKASENIYYFPNSAEEFYHPVNLEIDASERDLFPDGFRVVFAGNIGVAQDFGTILSAAEELKHISHIQWIIIGDGRRRAWVEAEIVKRGLEKSVRLLGRHPVRKMPRFFSLADALLVSLKNEPIFSYTIPSKLQSYMACAKPIIAALDGEGRRVVEEAGTGFTCPPENPKALADVVLKMSRLSAEERKSMGERGRAYFEKEFERNMLIDKLEGIMEELTRGNG